MEILGRNGVVPMGGEQNEKIDNLAGILGCS